MARGNHNRPSNAFEKGCKRLPNAGRTKGTPNKMSLAVKEVIESCAERLGGLERMVEWVKEDKENERIFWSSMYMKLLPLHIKSDGTGLVVVISRDELVKRNEERGLPSIVFGVDKPLLELKANNGKNNAR